MKKKDIYILSFIAILFSLSIIVFQFMNDDFATHVSRLYNLSLDFKEGNLNPYIYSYCNYNYGYPFGIFYPDSFFKPFAFLCSFGIDEYVCFWLLLVSINIATILIPYFLLKRENVEHSFLLSILYFIYPYRFYDFFIRYSIGELFAFIFLPFLIYGIYKMFYKKEFSLALFIGMCGIIHSHILSIFLFIIGLVVFYILNIKTIVKNTNIIKWTFMNAGLTVMTSLDVIIPIIESIFIEDLKFETNTSFMGNLFDNSLVILNSENLLPIQILIIGIIIILTIYSYKWTLTKKMILFLTILMLMCTNIFMWNHIIKLIPFLNIIQFPWRLLMFGCLPFVYLCYKGLQTKKIEKAIKILTTIIFVLELLITFLLGSMYYDYSFEIMKSNVGAGDYLSSEIKHKDISFYNYNTEYGNAKNNTYLCENGYVPIFYYHNYVIKDTDNNYYEYENKNGLIFINELQNTTQYLIIEYQNSLLQNISYYFSIISFIIILVYYFRKYLNKKKST